MLVLSKNVVQNTTTINFKNHKSGGSKLLPLKETIGSLLNRILFSDFCPDVFVEDAEHHKFYKMTFSSFENWWIFLSHDSGIF